MKRREFLKDAGIFGCGCALGAGSIKLTSANKEKQKITSKNDIYSDWLPHVEILITHHCNLNCAYCAHCAPLAPIYFESVDIFEKDIIQLYKITQGKIKEIMLLGGEPLLNKNIEVFIKLTRKYFKKSEIIIVTNGLMLNDMPDSFWKTCNENNASIYQSLYPLYERYPNLKKSYLKAIKYNVKMSAWTKYTFTSLNLNKNAFNEKTKAYGECPYKINCTILTNGILYPCGVISSVHLFFNKYFKDFAIPVDEKDYLDIYKIKSLDEIFKFFEIPKETCKYCDYKRKKRKLWTLSKKELCEWYDAAKA